MNRVNAVVVGAGAGGGIVAKELAVAGLSVVLLERGKWYTPPIAARTICATSARPCWVMHLVRRTKATRVCGWMREAGAHTVVPSDGAYSNNAACVGGGTLSWGAQAWRYMPQDFKMRSTYGAPVGSSLEDWPITYDDLEPFYDKAEYEIGVSWRLLWHAPQRASQTTSTDAAVAAQSRVWHSGTGSQAARASSAEYPHGAKQRAV